MERDAASGVEPALPIANTSRGGGFDEIYREHALWAARLAYLLSGDSAAAEDLTQEAFLSFYQHADRVDKPRAYLRATLVNLAGRTRRRERRRVEVHRIATQHEIVSDASNELFDVLSKLPAKQRVVIVLRYYEGLSEAEIAAALECAPGTVKSLASRAIDRLRKEVPR